MTQASNQSGYFRTRLSWILNLLLVYLAAITIFGKGPTYIGVRPLFWGEAVLFLSLIWTFRHWNPAVFRSLRVRVLTLLILTFMGFGAMEAVTDFNTWGMDTLRDSALWYYALFYFVGLTIASNRQRLQVFSSRWELFFVVAIPWAIAEVTSGSRLSAMSPEIFRGPILGNEGHDIVQSMGLGCLLILSRGRRGGSLGYAIRMLLAVAGLAAVIAFWGRGARVAILATLALLVVFSIFLRTPGTLLRRRLSMLTLAICFAAIVAIGAGFPLSSALHLDRFEGASLDSPDGTAEWRTDWWRALGEEVVARNPLLGVGFGENLADYNPDLLSQENIEFPVRSPHNFNVTVFARMGIIGSTIWAGILFMGLFVPFYDVLSKSTLPELEESKKEVFWILALFAIWINASFGVLMEGPVTGIPFWLILGLVSGKLSLNYRRSAAVSSNRRLSMPTQVSNADKVRLPAPI